MSVRCATADSQRKPTIGVPTAPGNEGSQSWQNCGTTIIVLVIVDDGGRVLHQFAEGDGSLGEGAALMVGE